jgi:serine acetyltransferase
VRVVANSVVMTDVADNLTVVGVPARIRWRNRPPWPPGRRRASSFQLVTATRRD